MIVPDPSMSPPDAKRVLRRLARARRAARSATDRLAHGRALAAVRHPALDAASSVTGYLGVGDEPNTRPLLDGLRARGVRVLLPVVLPDLSLEWAEYDGPDSLVESRHGLLEPGGPRLGKEAIGTVDVVLVPGFAIDPAGRRLGQGGGCYDRALAHVPAGTPVLAVVFPDEVVTEPLPNEPHDRRVSGVLIPPG